MSRLYSIDVMICATAYIKADSPAGALAKLNDMKSDSLEVPTIGGGEGFVEISDYQFNDPRLPECSLSPAMTIHGVFTPGAQPEPADE